MERTKNTDKSNLTAEGFSLKEKESNRSGNFDSSVELLKIQIFSERAHSRLTTTITNVYALFVGFLVLFYTLFYENVLPLFGFVFGLTVFIVSMIYEVYHVRQVFRRDVKRISEMIEAVKAGKELPKLEEILN